MAAGRRLGAPPPVCCFSFNPLDEVVRGLAAAHAQDVLAHQRDPVPQMSGALQLVKKIMLTFFETENIGKNIWLNYLQICYLKFSRFSTIFFLISKPK